MNNEKKNSISIKNQKNNLTNYDYSINDAIKEFDELKNIALNSFDKNGNPNISAAIRAVEHKAKVAGLYNKVDLEVANVVKMENITINGEQLKLNIGEEFL